MFLALRIFTTEGKKEILIIIIIMAFFFYITVESHGQSNMISEWLGHKMVGEVRGCLIWPRWSVVLLLQLVSS